MVLSFLFSFNIFDFLHCSLVESWTHPRQDETSRDFSEPREAPARASPFSYRCMCISLSLYIYIYIHTYHYIYIYIHICMCVYIYIYTYIYLYNIYIYIYICYRRLRKKHSSGENNRWEDRLSEHRKQGPESCFRRWIAGSRPEQIILIIHSLSINEYNAISNSFIRF